MRPYKSVIPHVIEEETVTKEISYCKPHISCCMNHLETQIHGVPFHRDDNLHLCFLIEFSLSSFKNVVRLASSNLITRKSLRLFQYNQGVETGFKGWVPFSTRQCCLTVESNRVNGDRVRSSAQTFSFLSGLVNGSNSQSQYVTRP